MERFANWPPSWATLFYLPALLVGFTVHELAHALVAYLLGDTSQVERKRLSFNPLRHVSWLGMALFLLLGFGWAKPVWVDPSRFQIKNRAFGMFLVSIAGVTANLLLALLVLLGLLATSTIVPALTGAAPWDVLVFLTARKPELDLQGAAMALSTYMMTVNLALALFNLLPLPPLDGFQALMSLYTLVRGALRRTDRAGPAPQEAGPSPARIHLDIGLEYHREGQWDEAIARYRQALAHDGGLALAHYNLGLAYLAKERPPLAANAFRAAMQSSRDVGLRFQADLRLRELARAERDPAVELAPLPPPLEPGVAPPPAAEAAPLDPALARRLWLRLAIGGGGLAVLAVLAWVFVTAVTFQAMM